MKTIGKIVIGIFMILVFTLQAHADAPKWALDPAHSSIYFSVKHIYSVTRGYFEDFSGMVMF